MDNVSNNKPKTTKKLFNIPRDQRRCLLLSSSESGPEYTERCYLIIIRNKLNKATEWAENMLDLS